MKVWQCGQRQTICESVPARSSREVRPRLLVSVHSPIMMAFAGSALEVVLHEDPTKSNPLGVKGVGQSGAIGAPQTVMAAVLDALGVAELEMPATSESVWRALWRDKIG